MSAEEKTEAGSQIELSLMAISAIKIGPRHRQLNEAVIAELEESLAHEGMLQPITVTTKGLLVCGRHRLEAARRLGWQKVPVITRDMDPLQAEAAEIEENLVRGTLTHLERSEHLGRRKELFLKIHPGGKRGGAPGKSRGGKLPSQLPSFIDGLAKSTGRSRSGLFEEIRLATAIDAAVRDRIRSTLLADSKKHLRQLAATPSDEQMALAERLLDEARAAEGEQRGTAHADANSRHQDGVHRVGAEGTGEVEDRIAALVKDTLRGFDWESLSPPSDDNRIFSATAALLKGAGEILQSSADGRRGAELPKSTTTTVDMVVAEIASLQHVVAFDLPIVSRCACDGSLGANCKACDGTGGFTRKQLQKRS